MKRGPPRQPTLLAKLHGLPRRRGVPQNEPEGVGDLWAAPAWFDDEHLEAWAYALEHSPPGLLSGTDRQMLVAFVSASIQFERAAQQVQQLGQVIVTKEHGPKLNPYMRVMNAQSHIMIRTAGELGFSPSARAGLGTRGPEFPHEPTPTGPAARSRIARYLEAKPDKLDS